MVTLSRPTPKAMLAPGNLPGIGHLFQLARYRMGFLTRLNACGGLVEVRLGTKPAYVVTDPDLLHQMLVTDAHRFDKGRMFDKARRFIGNGIATANNADHRPHRKMLQPAFHWQRIAGYVDTMCQVTKDLIDTWQPGQRVDIRKAMDNLTMSIVAKVLFTAEIGARAAEQVHDCVPTIIQGTLVRGVIPSALEWIPLPDGRRYENAMTRMKEVIAEVVAGYRTKGVDHGDLLSMIIAAQNEETGDYLADQQIHDEVMTFLLGGVEVPAAALAWVLYEVVKDPKISEKLYAEVDSVLVGSSLSYESISQLKYTNQVINETLRLYSSTLLMRRVVEPVTLGGVPLPAGAEIIFSPYAIHRDPRWFPEPERFDPDRWSPERAVAIPRNAFVPFGAGARMCIANSFAMTEMATVIALIAARWRLELVPGERVRAIARAAVHPSRMTMTCHPRKQPHPQI